MLTEIQCPPTWPYGLPSSGLKSKGPTAVALKRAMSRLGLLPWQEFDEHFNQPLSDALAKWDPGKAGYGKGRWEKIRNTRIPASLPHGGEYALDGPALNMIRDEYVAAHPTPPDAPPVASLHHSLWESYAEALRTPGLFSLGTYNPDSRLPSGLPSDHAVYPAYAFDIGFDPDTGWNNPVARAYAEKTAKRPEVEYVILGNRIHINGAWKAYSGGGHLNHIHVSGHH